MGHRTPTWGPKVVPSAPELPLWGSETHGVILIEGKVSICPHKGSKVTRIFTYRSRWGGGVGVYNEWGKGSPQSHIRSELERESRVYMLRCSVASDSLRPHEL